MVRRSKQWQAYSATLLISAMIAMAGPVLAQGLAEPRTNLGDALSQPLRDLNVMRRDTADILTRAATDSYNTFGLDDCALLSDEIRRLDVVLGPDVDAARGHSRYGAGDLAVGAVSSVVELPFSGIIRRLTGAYSQDQIHRRALLAGMVRRGYLNGISHAKDCDTTFVSIRLEPDTLDLASPREVIHPQCWS